MIQAGDAASAIPEFEAALRLQPDDTGYRTNLGTAYLQKADFDAAIAQFQSALKATPQDATLHYDLGLALKLKDQIAGGDRRTAKGRGTGSPAARHPLHAGGYFLAARQV